MDSEFTVVLFSLCACSGSSSSGTTPFLYIWNGEKFRMENDVMFGKPSSSFDSIEKGKQEYLEGNVQSDIYFIGEQLVQKNGRYELLIKEIEPAKSAIDFLRLKTLVHSSDLEPVARTDFKGYLFFSKDELRSSYEAKKICKIDKPFSTSKVTENLDKNAETDIVMERGDSLDCTFRVDTNKSGQDVQLVIESVYRDWALGDVYRSKVSEIQKSGMVLRNRKWSHKILAGSLAAFVGLVGWGHSTDGDNQKEEKLAESFGIEKAFASHPYSQGSYSGGCAGSTLFISCWNGSEYVNIAMTHPRYKKVTKEAIPIPSQFINADGEVKVRIHSTKKHILTNMGMLAAVDEADAAREYTHTLGSIKKTDAGVNTSIPTEVLDEEKDGRFLGTVAGDSFLFSFDSVDDILDKNGYTTSHFIEIGGVYSDLSNEEQKSLGEWTDKLDDEAIEFLGDVYQFSR